ncbi:MAG: glutamate racemase [Ferruginibacter sp.]
MKSQPIGIFDSGYGGLTVLKKIIERLPQYDYLYLGDNARAPYGPRSFDTVYQYTLQCVEWFFKNDCDLLILACNTASAKALRTIQQNDLSRIGAGKRVLGVIRPTTEVIATLTKTRSVGIMGTAGTVESKSYPIEINKLHPQLSVYQEACPMWVPLVENNEQHSAGADYFVKRHIDNLLDQSPDIDCLLLACTHYPLMIDKIMEFVPAGINVISQGEIVAESLLDYLFRHPEIEEKCSKNGDLRFFTTDDPHDFDAHAGLFFGNPVKSSHVNLA